MNYLKPINSNLRVRSIKYLLIPIWNKFLEAATNGEIITLAGNRYSKGSIKGYRNTRDLLIEYQNKYGRIRLDDINEDWVAFFTRFMAVEKNFSKATIATVLGRLKAIMNRAFRSCITHRNGACIRLRKEYVHKVYCSISDLIKINNTQYKRKSFYKIKDIFLLNCFTAMRISDLWLFLKKPQKYIIEEDGNKYIIYYSQKVNRKTIIPFSKVLEIILNKYSYDFGKSFSQTYYRKCLKLIAKEAGLTDKIYYTQTIGGRVTELVKEKWQMITPHTARRTFASLAELMQMPRANIMKMTGHTTEQTFNQYVRISELENAIRIKKHEFFKINLQFTEE